jgi:hypothetical protein
MYFGNLQYRPSSSHRSRHSGYMLLVLIFLMTGMIIAALAMAPAIATQIKRDREQEMIHRGVQYARAVQKYYKKFGRYPPTLEALEDTNHIRFLRKRYKDPLTEDGKWQVVRFGQVQMNATQRQGGAAGTGFSAGGTGLPNVPGVTGLLTGQTPQTGQGQQLGGLTPGGAGSTTGSTGTTTGTPDTTGSGGTTGTTGSSGSSFGSSFGQSNTAGGNQQFGGGAIIGVASLSDKESLRVVDDKNHYKDWKFIYDPSFDRGPLISGPYDPKKQMGQFPGASQPGQQIGTPAGQQSSTGFGNNPTGSTFGQPSQGPTPQPYQPPDQNAPPPNPQ